jgi:D-beta-D-heptose 7-phosphate kinase/D-beta-D-heptose 1-phosphate adenosyltransferase
VLTGRAHVEAAVASLRRLAHDADRLDALGRTLGRRLAAGAQLLAAGNGGSAATAQHLTAELVGRYRYERDPLAAIALHAETSTFTALTNDYPAVDVFARQVRAFGRAGDILVCISSSGRSANLLAAAAAAHERAMSLWALTTEAPNPLAEAADEVVAVPASYGPTVQELHDVVVHVLAAAVDAELAP